MILQPAKEQEELEKEFNFMGLDNQGYKAVCQGGELANKNFSKYSSYGQSVPFSATYKIDSDQLGKR